MSNSADKLLYLLLSLAVCTGAIEALHDVHHILNAVHSSMRQWGSSLNHNGMSFFRAEVPKGFHLYHGTNQPERVVGTEWLAFEPEHALNFAFKLCDGDGNFMPQHANPMSPRWWAQRHTTGYFPFQERNEEVLGASPKLTPLPLPPPCVEPGWLHTYAATKNLKLLYIDGTSAANSDRGTLDSQDFVLLWNKSKEYDPDDPLGERRRARGLCELAQFDFKGKIDGFIRMEHGFEIILCDFSALEVVSILRSARDTIKEDPIERNDLDTFSFLRAVTSRYLGIGAHRVQLDYDNFVTAFGRADVDLWTDGCEQPRLNRISNATASSILNEVKQLVLSISEPDEDRVDWQGVADMYITRYARPIRNMASATFDDVGALHDEMLRLFQPYLNRTTVDSHETIKRCREAYIPAHLTNKPQPSLGQQVTEESMHHFCSYLHMVLMEKNGLELQKLHLRNLIDTFKWTTWKDCEPGCAINELCFAAIWPFGIRIDHDEPSCLNATAFRGRFGYWEDPVC